MEIIKETPITDRRTIFQRIKEKGEKNVKKINERNKTTKFNLDELVLVKTYHISDASNRTTSKFCNL